MERFYKRLVLVILLPLFILIFPVAWGTQHIARLYFWLRG